ncbi:hypothetical protein [Deinococcus peraridilitoris]|uniref:Uncharacterized protein n=1 Tax=Deinococcus peraridilitoris (strain DSM 19664 / LMG 22246 / CIP 109416 / KR-200) TaxID=937777 RepID=L0A0J5_DEIPD|nr:hypothetical protein [Deinococcus peraridilitoris]AFZ66979.1 hypothetical protein Deipe_1438 [Deinococcus peraridilitoris DSM 19664]
MALFIEINGVDRAAQVEWASVVVAYNLTSQVDTFNFTMRLAASQLPLIPSPPQTVVFREDTEVIFAGVIVQAPRQNVGNTGEVIVPVTAHDNQTLLTRKQIAATYENVTAGAIVRDIVAQVGNGFTTNGVQDGPVMKKYAINYRNAADAIEDIARLAGFDWFVSSTSTSRDVVFRAPGEAPEAWALTEEASTPFAASAPYSDLLYTEDVLQVRNVVTVKGARMDSDLVTQDVKADGVQRSFALTLGEVTEGSFIMKINGVGQLVGEEGVADVGTVDWLVNYKNRVVLAAKAGTPTPAAGATVSLVYRYFTQIITRARDEASIARFGEWEHTVTDEQITSRPVANAVAKAQLVYFAAPAMTIQYKTTRPGLTSGLRQRVNVPRLGVSSTFLLQNVELRLRGFTHSTTLMQGASVYLREWFVTGSKVVG